MESEAELERSQQFASQPRNVVNDAIQQVRHEVQSCVQAWFRDAIIREIHDFVEQFARDALERALINILL